MLARCNQLSLITITGDQARTAEPAACLAGGNLGHAPVNPQSAQAVLGFRTPQQGETPDGLQDWPMAAAWGFGALGLWGFGALELWGFGALGEEPAAR